MGHERHLTCGLLCAALAWPSAAHALVGAASPAGDAGPPLVMVLAQEGGAAGFCSGIVLAPDVVLTAAHCVRGPDETRVHLADPTAPALLPVRTVAVHPLYRADAVRRRERSIDLALLRLERPLPAAPHPPERPGDGAAEPGAAVRLAGFGLSDEAVGKTGGTLRVGAARVRRPRSDVLLWLEGPSYACTGDSGGAVLDAASGALVGLIAWAGGTDGRRCGALTQAIRLAPVRGWIDGVLASWR